MYRGVGFSSATRIKLGTANKMTNVPLHPYPVFLFFFFNFFYLSNRGGLEPNHAIEI